MLRPAHALALLGLLVATACSDDDAGAEPGPDASNDTTDVAPDAVADTADAGDTAPVPPGPATTVLVPAGFATDWAQLPHRLSSYEVTLEHGDDPDAASLVARNDGGPWGAIESSSARYHVEAVSSPWLRAATGSVLVELPPGTGDEGVGVALELDAASLGDAETLVALVRGINIETNLYEEPPAFATDPDLPYDPADGFTTQGFGVALGDVGRDGGTVTVPVRVRNLLGIADRGDMNAAIPQATTWVRVDVTVLGALGDAAVATGDVTYDLGNADYGSNTVVEHASAAQQRVAIQGEAGRASAVFGVQGFDLWLNVDGMHASDCVVVQDDINAWSEPISGPGRYVRDVTMWLGDASYDADAGTGTASFDLHLSNRSAVKEIGNICLRATGTAAMLQFADPSPERCRHDLAIDDMTSGDTSRLELGTLFEGCAE